MLRTLAVILLLPGCARLAVSLNRAEEKGSKTALARAQAQLIRRVLRGETHYDVLDLPANSTTEEIKAARDDLADALAFAEDDEQAEGLSRVLEDCIGGESEDVLYDDDDVDDEEEYVDDDSDDGDGDY